MNGYVNMTNNYNQILLIGPIVFAELEDRISGKTALVIANEPAALEKYCDEQEVEYPSLMPTQDRWHGLIYVVDDGQVKSKIILSDMDVIGMGAISSYAVHVHDGAATAVCPSYKTAGDIKALLERGGRLKVISVLPGDAAPPSTQ